jgi:hypothetical protein
MQETSHCYFFNIKQWQGTVFSKNLLINEKVTDAIADWRTNISSRGDQFILAQCSGGLVCSA